MVDTLGLPTEFFIHCAADLQWPELTRLTCPDDPDSSSARNKAVQENPAIADWSFYQCIVKFIVINSFNPIQLSVWRSNVDMEYCVSRRKVIEYCAKYATKSEPCSQPLNEIFATTVRSLKEDSSAFSF